MKFFVFLLPQKKEKKIIRASRKFNYTTTQKSKSPKLQTNDKNLYQRKSLAMWDDGINLFGTQNLNDLEMKLLRSEMEK